LASLRASASVEVSGLSQMTWMPRFRNSRASRIVHVVGRDDGHRLDAVFSRASRFGHLDEVAIGAVRREAEIGGRRLRFFRRRGKRAGDQFVAVVDARGDAVHAADEGVAPAADHAEADAARGGGAGILGGHV
jgi:hypothetical protein